MLEIGCGVGNAVIPLLEVNPKLHVVAIDFAKSAIDLLKQNHQVMSTGRILPSVCCIVEDSLPVEAGTMDLVLCMFVLSAIPPLVRTCYSQ